MDLTDEQWAVLEPLFTSKREPGKAGRPRQDARPVVEAVFGVLRTGAPYKDLPNRYPPYSSCHRWFQQWCDDGTLKEVLHELARDLRQRGGIDDIEAYIDGTYVPAKRGVLRRALPRRQRDEGFTEQIPSKLIADKAFDSQKLAVSLRDERNVELIAPKRSNSHRRRQDGRALRRYKRRWKAGRCQS